MSFEELVAAILSVSVDFPLSLLLLIGSVASASFFIPLFSEDWTEDCDSKTFPSAGLSSKALLALSLVLPVTDDGFVIDVDATASAVLLLLVASAALMLVVAEAGCAGSGATARSRFEEVAGAPALDLFRFVFLEDDIVVSYSNSVVIMCIFC